MIIVLTTIGITLFFLLIFSHFSTKRKVKNPILVGSYSTKLYQKEVLALKQDRDKVVDGKKLPKKLKELLKLFDEIADDVPKSQQEYYSNLFYLQLIIKELEGNLPKA